MLLCTGGVPDTAWAAAVLGGRGAALRVHPDLRVVGADRVYAAGDVVGGITGDAGGGGVVAADQATAPAYERTAYAAVSTGTLAARNIVAAAAATPPTPSSTSSSVGACRQPEPGSGTYPADAFPFGRFPLLSIVSTGPRDAVAVAGHVVVATGWVAAAAKAAIRWLAVGGVAEQPPPPPPRPSPLVVGRGRGSRGAWGRWRWRWRLFMAAEAVSCGAVNAAAATVAAFSGGGAPPRPCSDARPAAVATHAPCG